MFTRNGKSLTAKGIKPICPFHQVFKSLNLFGAFTPLDGDSFLMEMPNCNADAFQIYLNELALHRADEFKIVVLDNGAFHKAKKLIIPANIALIFLPPYSPEINPAEKMWWQFKRGFTNILCHSLKEVSAFVSDFSNSLHPQNVMRTCAIEYVFEYFNWTI